MTLTRKSIVKAYLGYCLCMDCDVFIRLFGGLSSGGAQFAGFQSANPILLLFSAMLVGGTLLLILPMHQRAATVLVNNPWFTGLYICVMVSAVWAVQPGTVIRLGLPLWSYLLCGIVAAHYLSIEEVASVVGNLMSGVALVSALWERIDPVRNSAAPGWTGIFGEKNHLGMGMGVGLIALVAAPQGAIRYRGPKIALCAVLLAGSRSTTAIVFVLLSVALYGFFRMHSRLRPLVASLFLAAVAIPMSVKPGLIGSAFALAGKDTNFTGRDVIWRFVYEQWITRPLLGFGYANFWTTQDAVVQQTLHWNPGSAHNGFLEILVNLGCAGEVLLLGALAGGVVLARRALRAGHRSTALWLSMAWLAMIVDDLTEADFIVPAPLWFVYCLVFFCAYEQVRRPRAAQRELVEPALPMIEAMA